jgi:hypothetical protein
VNYTYKSLKPHQRLDDLPLSGSYLLMKLTNGRVATDLLELSEGRVVQAIGRLVWQPPGAPSTQACYPRLKMSPMPIRYPKIISALSGSTKKNRFSAR